MSIKSLSLFLLYYYYYYYFYYYCYYNHYYFLNYFTTFSETWTICCITLRNGLALPASLSRSWRGLPRWWKNFYFLSCPSLICFVLLKLPFLEMFLYFPFLSHQISTHAWETKRLNKNLIQIGLITGDCLIDNEAIKDRLIKLQWFIVLQTGQVYKGLAIECHPMLLTDAAESSETDSAAAAMTSSISLTTAAEYGSNILSCGLSLSYGSNTLSSQITHTHTNTKRLSFSLSLSLCLFPSISLLLSHSVSNSFSLPTLPLSLSLSISLYLSLSLSISLYPSLPFSLSPSLPLSHSLTLSLYPSLSISLSL